MPELNIEPPDESTARSVPATIGLRIGAAFLGTFMGFSLYIGGYLNILFLLNETPGEDEYIIGRFALSILIWTLLGLFTPLSRIKDFFVLIFGILRSSPESGSLAALGRLTAAAIILVVVLILYWHLIDLIASVINSLFG